MATHKKKAQIIPGEMWDKRRLYRLSCSRCPRSIDISVYPDPEVGDGWPKHRCGRDVLPFDILGNPNVEKEPRYML